MITMFLSMTRPPSLFHERFAYSKNRWHLFGGSQANFLKENQKLKTNKQPSKKHNNIFNKKLENLVRRFFKFFNFYSFLFKICNKPDPVIFPRE